MQFGDPGLAGESVFEVEPGRRRVFQRYLLAKVVLVSNQDVRLLATHQVYVLERGAGVLGETARPHDTGHAVPEQVRHRYVRLAVYLGEGLYLKDRGAEAVAAQVFPAGEFALPQIDDVGGAGAVNVGQPQVGGVERVEIGRAHV